MNSYPSSPYLSIVLITFQRPLIFSITLEFILSQRFTDFELIIVDNGSGYASKVIDGIRDSRIKLLTLGTNNPVHVALNTGIQLATGEVILPFCADDDIFLPSYLEIVHDAFQDYCISSLNCGSLNYNFITGQLTGHFPNGFTGIINRMESDKCVQDYTSGWGIGSLNTTNLPRMGHPSGLWFRRKTIQELMLRQGSVFFPPFADVSLLSAFLLNASHHYIDLPLILIGEGHTKETDNQVNRLENSVWVSLAKQIKYSPLRACTFTNLGMESHAGVLVRAGKGFSERQLRLDFFTRHINEILTDLPLSNRTIADFDEAKIYLLGMSEMNVSLKIPILNFINEAITRLNRRIVDTQKSPEPNAEVAKAQVDIDFEPLKRSVKLVSQLVDQLRSSK